jgi:hypothetical protein
VLVSKIQPDDVFVLGETKDGAQTIRVLAVPADVPFTEIGERVLSQKCNIPFFIRPWEAVFAPHIGDAVTMDEAGRQAGVKADAIKKYILNGLLPSFRPRKSSAGNRPHMINSSDLRWFLDNVYKQR